MSTTARMKWHMALMRGILLLLLFLLLAPATQAQSLDSLRAQAARGNVQAQLRLSEWYRFGLEEASVSADSANHYLRQAAQQGSAEATYLLAVAHVRGLGMPIDPKRGRQLMEEAAKAGQLAAILELMHLHSQREHRFFPQAADIDSARAAHYARLAAKRGAEEARLFLATAHERGSGVKPSDSLARHYLQAAVKNNGSARAALRLADGWYYGRWKTGMSLRRALQHYRRGEALAGNAELRAEGKIGRFNVRRLNRRMGNLQLMLGSLEPLSAPWYRLR